MSTNQRPPHAAPSNDLDYSCLLTPCVSPDIVEDVLCFGWFFLELIEARVEEHLHPVYLLLHQAAWSVRQTEHAAKQQDGGGAGKHIKTHS